jgi:hypothetical protein
MSDVVVNLSGIVSLQSMEGKTANQLINLALANWGIPKESVEGPFVTVHNMQTNKHKPLQGEEVVINISDHDIVRVVLPLKSNPMQEKDTKQYLVE